MLKQIHNLSQVRSRDRLRGRGRGRGREETDRETDRQSAREEARPANWTQRRWSSLECGDAAANCTYKSTMRSTAVPAPPWTRATSVVCSSSGRSHGQSQTDRETDKQRARGAEPALHVLHFSSFSICALIDKRLASYPEGGRGRLRGAARSDSSSIPFLSLYMCVFCIMCYPLHRDPG